MAYTAIKQMREDNLEKYGIDYPREPKDFRNKKHISNIERECLSFLRESCEELRFDKEKVKLEDRDGRSICKEQIPYNMEMDIDRMCLENAIHRFMHSGAMQDAFDVYFCYLEMFMGNYANSKKMIEMLAEFESNASTLLMKHRDHYSHSVYVFVIGLALYQKNEKIRNAYQTYYGISGKEAAHHYLKYWGLAALFHDIGYPFEIPFDQVKSYFFKDKNKDKDEMDINKIPFVSYKGVLNYVVLSEEESKVFGVKDLNELLARNIAEKLEDKYKKSQEVICKDILEKKPNEPETFNGYMDHAYFSAVLLLRQLIDMIGAKQVTKEYMDAITAIALHNSMYKFSITNVKDKQINQPFEMQLHPLAYMLMLCDELQCWDRVSYGQNSRKELHAMWCDLDISDDEIHAAYYFDKQQEYKKDTAKGTYQKMTTSAEGETPKFVREIEDIIEINKKDGLQLTIETAFIKNNRFSENYISNSSFLHLYNFAVALNGRYTYGNDYENKQKSLEDDFETLSLEYKLSNILQAKAFSKYLDAIGCFYTDRPVAYELLENFSEANMEIIGPMEHERWMKEKESMGWCYDTAYTDEERLKAGGVSSEKLKEFSKNLRELTRTHALMIEDYEELDKEEQDKDTEPMNCMLHLIGQYDGLRIYRIK